MNWQRLATDSDVDTGPNQFSSTSLFFALHDKSKSDGSESNGWTISRYRYFFYVLIAMFCYYVSNNPRPRLWSTGPLWKLLTGGLQVDSGRSVAGTLGLRLYHLD